MRIVSCSKCGYTLTKDNQPCPSCGNVTQTTNTQDPLSPISHTAPFAECPYIEKFRFIQSQEKIRMYDSFKDLVQRYSKHYSNGKVNYKDLLHLARGAMKEIVAGIYKQDDRLSLYNFLRDIEKEIASINLGNLNAFLPFMKEYRRGQDLFSVLTISIPIDQKRQNDYDLLLCRELQSEYENLKNRYNELLTKYHDLKEKAEWYLDLDQ